MDNIWANAPITNSEKQNKYKQKLWQIKSPE